MMVQSFTNSCIVQYCIFLNPLGKHVHHNNSEPFLLVADNSGGNILQVNITSGSTLQLPLGDVGMPTVLDYDPLTDYVYWFDTRDNVIKRAHRDGSDSETIIETANNDARGLALDYAAGNIYWSVHDTHTISVAKKNRSSARTLLTSPATLWPYNLVLDPRNGLLYWADGGHGIIHRAALDGSNHTAIIAGLSHPYAITIDYNEDRLYYRDQQYGIYSSDLLGNDVREVLYEEGKWVRGIAVDEHFIYWSSNWWDSSSSTNRGMIGKMSKSNMTRTVLVDGLGGPWGIYITEAGPTEIPCSPGYFSCGQGNACILAWRRCDDATDCPDGRDEEGCVCLPVPVDFNLGDRLAMLPNQLGRSTFEEIQNSSVVEILNSSPNNAENLHPEFREFASTVIFPRCNVDEASCSSPQHGVDTPSCL
uniref:EGF-like domain-containing protein n=1 Tax=Branchiostoma floridae TaxID=7739 RepID=C3Y988_BRAFL|eukprot:XP_002607134.1 hypothetical protein BRAFLDRAFT_68072 [Branchiostoma floridae]